MITFLSDKPAGYNGKDNLRLFYRGLSTVLPDLFLSGDASYNGASPFHNTAAGNDRYSFFRCRSWMPPYDPSSSLRYIFSASAYRSSGCRLFPHYNRSSIQNDGGCVLCDATMLWIRRSLLSLHCSDCGCPDNICIRPETPSANILTGRVSVPVCKVRF